jgi:hypothetical protein
VNVQPSRPHAKRKRTSGTAGEHKWASNNRKYQVLGDET